MASHPFLFIQKEPSREDINPLCCLQHNFFATNHQVSPVLGANATILFNSNPSDGEVVGVNGVSFQFLNSPVSNSSTQVQIGVNIAATVANFADVLGRRVEIAGDYFITALPAAILLNAINDGEMDLVVSLSASTSLPGLNMGSDGVFLENHQFAFVLEVWNGAFDWIKVDTYVRDVMDDSTLSINIDNQVKSLQSEVQLPDLAGANTFYTPVFAYRFSIYNRFGSPIANDYYISGEPDDAFFVSRKCELPSDCGKAMLLNMDKDLGICGNSPVILNYLVPDYNFEGWNFTIQYMAMFEDATSQVFFMHTKNNPTGGANYVNCRVPVMDLRREVLLSKTVFCNSDDYQTLVNAYYLNNNVFIDGTQSVDKSEVCFGGFELLPNFNYIVSIKLLNVTSIGGTIQTYIKGRNGTELLLGTATTAGIHTFNLNLFGASTSYYEVCVKSEGTNTIPNVAIAELNGIVVRFDGYRELKSLDIQPIINIGGNSEQVEPVFLNIEGCGCKDSYLFENIYGQMEALELQCHINESFSVSFSEAIECQDCDQIYTETLNDSQEFETNFYEIKTEKDKDIFTSFVSSENKYKYVENKYKKIVGISGEFVIDSKNNHRVFAVFKYRIENDLVSNDLTNFLV